MVPDGGFFARAPVGRAAANASRFSPRDPVREAGARTDDAVFTPARSSPPPLRCGGAFADERRVVAATEAAGCERETLVQPHRAVRLRRHALSGSRVAANSSPSRRSTRLASLETLTSHRPAHRPLSDSSRPRVAARSPMSGAS